MPRPMSQAPELSVVLPTLDEAAGLRVLLPRLKALFARLGVRGEVLVVDGGSRDETTAVAAEHGARVMRQRGRGFGSAVREGLQAAGAEWVALMDADGSHAPEDLERFWARRGEARLIVGSRYCRGGSADMPLLRQVLSRSLNIVTRLVLDLPVHESSSGFRLYHGPSARAVPCVATDFSVQQDLLVGILAAGGRVVEEPIHYAPRVGGASKANAWKLAPAYVRLLLRLMPVERRDLAVVLCVGLLTGLCGIRWGLPGPENLRAFPDRLKPTPEIAARFAGEWAKLYERIRLTHLTTGQDEPETRSFGVEEVRPGWDFPPPKLMESYRSLLLQSRHPDEKKSFIILSRMRPWRLEFRPEYVFYGGAFIYPLGACLGAAHLAGLATITSDMSHYLMNPADMGRLYLAGRLFMLLFQLGTILLLYRIGLRLSGRPAGIVAALLAALSPFVLVNAHILKPHSYSAFWALAAVYGLLEAASSGRRRDLVLCGLSAGMAGGSNFSLVALCAIPALAPLVAARRPRWTDCALAVAAALAVFVAANPYFIFDYKDFAWDVGYVGKQGVSWSARGLSTAFAQAASGVGLAASALGLAGLVVLSFSRCREKAMLSRGCLILLVLLWGKFGVFFQGDDPSALRLLHFPVLLSFVLGSVLLFEARVPRALRFALACALLAETALRGSVALANLHIAAGPRSTFSQAADWIEAAVPAGAEVGLSRYPEPSHTPPFRYDLYTLVVFRQPEKLEAGKLPGWVVIDTMDRDRFQAWQAGRYELAKSFLPWGLGPLDIYGYTTFGNQGIFVYRRAR